MRVPRTVKTATVSVLAAGTVALGAVQSASAASAPVSERYAARAGAQVAEPSLLGRTTTFGSAVTDSSLEAIGQQLTATATGIGADLSPTTRSVARFRDSGAAGLAGWPPAATFRWASPSPRTVEERLTGDTEEIRHRNPHAFLGEHGVHLGLETRTGGDPLRPLCRGPDYAEDCGDVRRLSWSARGVADLIGIIRPARQPPQALPIEDVSGCDPLPSSASAPASGPSTHRAITAASASVVTGSER